MYTLLLLLLILAILIYIYKSYKLEFTPKEITKLAAIFAGCAILGGILNLTIKDSTPTNTAEGLAWQQRVTFSTVKIGNQKCVIIEKGAILRSAPSNLQGRDIMQLPANLQVEFLKTVPSDDKNANVGIIAYDMEMKRLLHRSINIPKGTPVTIIQESSSVYKCTFSLDGKAYTREFDKPYITRAYTGDWQQVKINNEIGYIPAGQASEPKFM